MCTAIAADYRHLFRACAVPTRRCYVSTGSFAGFVGALEPEAIGKELAVALRTATGSPWGPEAVKRVGRAVVLSVVPEWVPECALSREQSIAVGALLDQTITALGDGSWQEVRVVVQGGFSRGLPQRVVDAIRAGGA